MERGASFEQSSSDARGVLSTRLVRVVLGAAIVSSILHYTDNLVNIEDYPQPQWVNEAVVPIAWALLTAVGVAGYVLYRRGSYRVAGACWLVYSYTGLSSLAHYSFGPLSDFSVRMHAGILLDGVTGAAVLVVELALLLRRR
jgi:hypothetical protein